MKTMTVALEPSFSTKVNKGGRPRKKLDPNTFEGLCEIQCTLEEIAGVLRVSEDIVERWCERTLIQAQVGHVAPQMMKTYSIHMCEDSR